MKKYYSILLVLILPYISLSQIKIEERVEVNPQKILPNNPNSGVEHIFTYTMTWPPSEYKRGNIQIIRDCPSDTINSGWSTSGITTISFLGDGTHLYLFQGQAYYNNGWWDSGPPSGSFLQVFVDGIDLNHLQYVLGHSDGVAGEFNLNINGSLCPSDIAALSINNIQWADCNEPNWYYSIDPIDLQIVEGQEFAYLYNIATDTDLGNFVQLVNVDEIQNIVLKGNESAPPTSTSQTVVLEANINGVIITQETDFPANIFEINTFQSKDSVSTGGYAYFEINVFNGCESIPNETKINVEIISGQQYGSLIDPYTYESTKSLINLDHWFGYVYIDYEADGISSTQTDTVIVKVSTTDPTIETKEITIYIKPPPIYAYTVPEVLGADDTADVIIKHRLEDGTLEDFPPEQTFELSVLDGCVNGNFLVDTTINVYFEDALLPIKFVTADIIDTTFDKVLIRVGIDIEGEGGGGISRPIGNINGEEEKITLENRNGVDTLRAGFEKMIAEKKAEAEKTDEGGNEPQAPIVPLCYPYGPNKEFNFNKNVVVGDKCDEDRPAGLTAIDENMYTINQLPNNTNCNVNNEEARLVGGRLMTTIHPPKLSDWGLSPRKSVVELRFTFDWSYCIDLLMQSFTKAQFIELEQVDNKYKVYNPIEGTFREINGPGEARKIISAIKEIGSDGRTIPENIEYYPLPRTKKHEFEHIVQYWDEISYNFFIALYHINKRQPPRNWCKLSEEEKHRIYNSEDEWYRITLDNAVNETLDYMNDKEQEKLNEASAHAVSYYYLHSVVIPRIKEQFKLP